MLGNVRVEFFFPPGKELAVSEPVKDGYTFVGEVSPEPVQLMADMQTSLRSVIGSVTTTSEHLNGLIGKLDHLVDGNREHFDNLVAA